MTLPTPPSTAHRDRDLRLPGSRVAWSQQNQYFVFTNSPKGAVPLPRHLEPPVKSILKKSSQCFLPVPEEGTRDVTPEPDDPLVNLTYLTRPVAQIIDPESSLRDLIEAYSILHARIRAAVTDSADGDASWPLFQPLRKNAQAFVDAVIRDLGRALVEPDVDMIQDDEPLVLDCSEDCEEETRPLLPSPRKSPKKKKRGMSAAQVKLARDLCTTTHAVLRLLHTIFTLPAVYQLFSEVHLGDMLTQVLAIPMADSLPTPNARKTCALSIWLLQAQRLPEEVLLPARDRIAFALRRGMEGELGKEGKKGSACDGLKAVHDLSLYQPTTFISAFAELLPSILSNLLAPTLTLRVQACHALGGFVLGCVALPLSSLHTRISNAIATFLTTPVASPLRPSKTPTKAKPEPLIVRTLRTTLNAVDPLHVAHGPVWALNVLASFIVLLGPKLCTDIRLTRVVSALLTLAIRNKKSSVRALGCLLWRCIIWSYMRPPLKVVHDSGEDSIATALQEQDVQLARENFWKLVRSVVDMGVGVSSVAALISDEYDDEDRLRKALELVKSMIQKGGQACEDGVEITRIFVSFESSGESWTLNKLLPHSLFSSNPGLLTAEYSGLSSVVRPIFEECPQFTDIRSLTREELSRDWVFDELIDLWKIALGSLRMSENYDLPRQGRSYQSNASIKLSIVRDLWAIMRTTFPNNLLHSGGAKLLARLIEDEEDLVEQAALDDTRMQWAHLCAGTMVVCDIDEARKFWTQRAQSLTLITYEVGVQSFIWRCFVEKWKEDAEGSWEGAIILLGVPFGQSGTWELSNEDFHVWDGFLQYAMDKARDSGLDTITFLDRVAEVVARVPHPGFASFTRIADLLLTHCEIADARQIPSNVFEFINDTLLSTYPPEPRNVKPSTWLIATLTRMIDACPLDLCTELLETLQDGISTWISDECHVFSEDEYMFDVLPLYQTALLVLKGLPGDSSVLNNLAPLLRSVFHGRSGSSSVAKEAFIDFWTTAFAEYDKPGGWPEDICTCLRYCDLTSDHITSNRTSSGPSKGLSDSTMCKNVASSVSERPCCSSQNASEDKSIPTTVHAGPEASGGISPIIGRLRPASFVPSTDSEELDINLPCLLPALPLQGPSTPTKRLLRATPPPRPQKHSTTPESYQSLILRPPAETLPIVRSTPSTPKHTPCCKITSSISPSKRAKLQDKENISPRPVLSVMERIWAKSSPGPRLEGSPSSVLGKRQMMEEPPYEGTLKRGRTAPPSTFIRSSIAFPSSHDSDMEDELAVEAALSPIGSRRSRRDASLHLNEILSGSPVSRKRKRQRLVFDAVVVPPLVDIRRQWQLQRRVSAEDAASSTSPCFLRAVSLPRLRESEGDGLPQLRAKRLKRWEDAELAGGVASSPPLRVLEDTVIVGSDDSIILTADSKSDLPSSDDDPHIGQVSPRHLASPAPRRRFDFDHQSSDEPPSSPSRELITRRQQRFGSIVL
ncbi:hypothetical protein ID866_4832 [Astraeus odoratus]|nr:hypothetical protein ID866_4832 [Astraeus odoratus]